MNLELTFQFLELKYSGRERKLQRIMRTYDANRIRNICELL